MRLSSAFSQVGLKNNTEYLHVSSFFCKTSPNQKGNTILDHASMMLSFFNAWSWHVI